ncbi:hypothetical protein BDQ17DRAFT_1232265 [Cyathus striatus]|nr:hypothetical protein BDQ17DRAFT_1232265 [Cyathus striatus]
MSFPQPPRSKGPKKPPRLPLSAFTPPNTGTSESFPLAPSPSTIHPEILIDANVVVQSKDLRDTVKQWSDEMAEPLEKRTGNVIISFAPNYLNQIAEDTTKDLSNITAAIVPFTLEKPESEVEKLISELPVPTSLSTVFTRASPEATAGLRWALERGRPVDIDVQAILSDAVLEELEDILSKAAENLDSAPPVILSNILPPPTNLDLPIEKLMNHPTYLAFQAQIAALSLFAKVYVKYLPPVWNAPTPHTPLPGTTPSSSETDIGLQKEWKTRIKMYLGPVIEAFGYERIIFGSSPSTSSRLQSLAADWYEIAREALAELGVEQNFVNAVFGGNAENVYVDGRN